MILSEIAHVGSQEDPGRVGVGPTSAATAYLDVTAPFRDLSGN